MIAAGIIAAGHGERLAAAGLGVPKPLAPVAGRPLCHWVVQGLRGAGVEEIVLLTNSRGGAVPESLSRAFPELRWHFLTADTASSWESFRLVASTLASEHGRFLMSTVDSLILPAEVARFARAAGAAEAALALTEFIDDEKPLWADLGEGGRIRTLGEAARERRYATAGLYALSAGACAELPAASAFGSLRQFLTALAEARPVLGVPLAKSLDVDRPEDLAAAESFLKEGSLVW